MKSFIRWTLCLVGSVAMTACGDSNNSNSDMAVAPAQVCTPSSKTCVDDHTAAVCTMDGLSELAVPCGIGQKCTNGTCGADPMAPCSSFDDTCMDAATALRCSATGLGFDVVTCPSGTACTGAGLCQGGCVVGSSRCLDTGHVATCMDGKTFTTTACDSAKSCVATGSFPYDTAECVTGDCTPDPNGCDFVCGNKADPMAANQNAVLSSCVETPNGFKWIALTCQGGTTCNPTARACSTGVGAQADCTSACTPGDTRCLDDLHIQTCGDDGNWPATGTACNANPLAAGLSCFSTQGGQAVCGDQVCANGDPGACDDQGKFHACGSNGKVAADGVACSAGQCVVTDGNNGTQWNGGLCSTECSAGDEQCAGGSTYQTCVNGLWGPPTQCAANATCLDNPDANGHPRKFCGDCIPGLHQCNGAQIETCGAGGTFGAAADCTTGSCHDSLTLTDASCIADCIPGKKLCLGSTTTVPGIGVQAKDSEGTCTAQGTIPAATACGAGTYCRRGPSADAGSSPGDPGSGTPLGCVVCVGGQNEFGLRDTKCGDDAGTGTGNFLTTCLANSSGWDGANNNDCTGTATPTCIGPSTFTPPPQSPGAYCHSFQVGPFTFLQLSESAIKAYCEGGAGCPTFSFPGETYCELANSDNPNPQVSCPNATGATISDCCETGCQPDPIPTAASCN